MPTSQTTNSKMTGQAERFEPGYVGKLGKDPFQNHENPLRLARILSCIVQFIAALVVVLVMLEVIFYAAGIGEQEFLQVDANNGFAPMPGKKITWRFEGYSRTQFNSVGMPDREYTLAKPSNGYRVAVLGDSYVESLQVEREATFCRLLEKDLQKAMPGKKVEVMNFGVSSYSLGQTYKRLKDMALAYNPDLVLVTVSIDSSFRLLPNPKGGFLYARPSYFAVGNNKVVEDRTVQNMWQKTMEAKRIHATSWLRQHSRVWGVISTAASAWNTWCKNFGKPSFTADQPVAQTAVKSTTAPRFVSSTKNEEQCTVYSWPIAQGLIKLIQETCQEKNCPLIFIRIPGPDGRENKVETQLLMQSTQKYAIPCLDLTPAFQNELLKQDTIKQQDLKQPLFFQSHFTETGHKLAEQSIFPFVLRQVQK
jgi:hypothetical protein